MNTAVWVHASQPATCWHIWPDEAPSEMIDDVPLFSSYRSQFKASAIFQPCQVQCKVAGCRGLCSLVFTPLHAQRPTAHKLAHLDGLWAAHHPHHVAGVATMALVHDEDILEHDHQGQHVGIRLQGAHSAVKEWVLERNLCPEGTLRVQSAQM